MREGAEHRTTVLREDGSIAGRLGLDELAEA